MSGVREGQAAGICDEVHAAGIHDEVHAAGIYDEACADARGNYGFNGKSSCGAESGLARLPTARVRVRCCCWKLL